MGLKDRIKSIFSKDPALESASTALQSASNPSINDEKHSEIYENHDFQSTTRLSHPIELEKESLQLGVAAGYTGKSIREIESSLSRIESQMASKEWFSSNFEDNSPQMMQLLEHIKSGLEKHDYNMTKRFEFIEHALNRMSSTASSAPEPIRTDLVSQIEEIRSNLPLTAKMKELVDVVKSSNEISYDDLSEKLGISRSSLRGLLSNTMKRTNEITRQSVGGKGRVIYQANQ